jgi:hypothetical protein
VHLERGDVNRDALTLGQREQEFLAVAMSGYVHWLKESYAELSGSLPGRKSELRERLIAQLEGSHPRTPDTVASLLVGFEVFRDYAVFAGAITPEEGEKLLKVAEGGLLEAAQAHVDSNSGADPASRFLDLLRSLFDGHGAYVTGKTTGKSPYGLEEKLGWVAHWDQDDAMSYRPATGAKHVGWGDHEYLYLDKNAAYGAVSEYARRGEIAFGVNQLMVWKALAQQGISIVGKNRSVDKRVRIEGRPRWVVQLPLEAVLGKEEEDEDYLPF